MIWTVVVALFILWLFGLTFSIGGGLVHTLLVVVLIIIIARLLS